MQGTVPTEQRCLARARAPGNLFQILFWMCITHTQAAGCWRRVFLKDLPCAHSKKTPPEQNTALPTLFLPKEKPRVNSKHTQELVYLCAVARCSEEGGTCQACRHCVGCSRWGMGYFPAGGFQFAAKGLQIHSSLMLN